MLATVICRKIVGQASASPDTVTCRDVHDHVVTVVECTTSVLQIVASGLDEAYVNETNRQNEVDGF